MAMNKKLILSAAMLLVVMVFSGCAFYGGDGGYYRDSYGYYGDSYGHGSFYYYNGYPYRFNHRHNGFHR
jgi:hypothetical protein